VVTYRLTHLSVGYSRQAQVGIMPLGTCIL
jgi:hypothetical protein